MKSKELNSSSLLKTTTKICDGSNWPGGLYDVFTVLGYSALWVE